MALNRQDLREQLKEQLVERILNGTYMPGTRITASELMAEFGVSQAPVREALRELEARRLIESKPHRGVRVRLLSRTELTEMYPVRAALEETAGRIGAPTIGADTLVNLRGEIDAMLAAAERGDLRDENLHDYRFHELIFESCGNTLLLETWHSLHFEIRSLVTYVALPSELGHIAMSHRPILQALEKHDPVRAASEMRRHVERWGALTVQRHAEEDELNESTRRGAG